MSMLNFYLTRTGQQLNALPRRLLDYTKGELQTAYNKKPGRQPTLMAGFI